MSLFIEHSFICTVEEEQYGPDDYFLKIPVSRMTVDPQVFKNDGWNEGDRVEVSITITKL